MNLHLFNCSSYYLFVLVVVGIRQAEERRRALNVDRTGAATATTKQIFDSIVFFFYYSETTTTLPIIKPIQMNWIEKKAVDLFIDGGK